MTASHLSASHSPLRGERVVIVGAGRVGRSLYHWLDAKGARIEAMAGRNRPADFDRFPDTPYGPRPGPAWRSLDGLRSDDATLLILAVSDPALADVAEALAERPQAPVALHVSGHFDAESIAGLRRAGSSVASWHPLRAFTKISRDAADAAGLTFAIDGDARALDLARRLTRTLDAETVEVSGEERKLYHLAASLAAGGVITILSAVDHLRRQAGLPDTLMRSYLHLTRGAIAQLPVQPPISEGAVAQAITGPAARGDHDMLTRQHAAVATLAPELLPLIETLAGATRILRADAPLSGEESGVEAAAAPPNHR